MPVYLVTVVAIEGNVRWTMLIPASVTIFGLLPHEVRITNPIISIPKFNFLISVFILVFLLIIIPSYTLKYALQIYILKMVLCNT